jgi:hypothetical protein
MDDSTQEDEEPDASELTSLAEGSEAWLDEPTDAPDLDLGEMAVIDFAELPPGPVDEEPGAGDEDFGFGQAPEHGNLDSGDEGPLDPDEELREADLPALDADDEGDLDEGSLVEAGFAGDEHFGLPWAAEPWSRVGSPLPLSSGTALACAPRGALVAGWAEAGDRGLEVDKRGRAGGAPARGVADLARVDLEGTYESLPARGLEPARVRSLAVEGDFVVALVEGGRLLVSRDGGLNFQERQPTSRDPEVSRPSAGSGSSGVAQAQGSAVQVDEVALASGKLWARTRTGGLLVGDARSVTGGQRLEALPSTGGPVAALARDPAGGVVALLVDGAARPAALLRLVLAGDASGQEAFGGPEVRSPALLSVRGPQVAFAARRGGVARRTAAGDATTEHSWDGTVTALCFLDDRGALIAATYCDADDTTALVLLDREGSASVVARVGPAHPDIASDGRVQAMAFDEARGVVWVAGGFGVVAFAVR